MHTPPDTRWQEQLPHLVATVTVATLPFLVFFQL
jgi:hypothetical protein